MSADEQERRDAFNAWRDNPETKRFMQALQAKADEAKGTWVQRSWGDDMLGSDDWQKLYQLRADCVATAETCQYAIDMDFEEREDMLNVESERD